MKWVMTMSETKEIAYIVPSHTYVANPLTRMNNGQTIPCVLHSELNAMEKARDSLQFFFAWERIVLNAGGLLMVIRSILIRGRMERNIMADARAKRI